MCEGCEGGSKTKTLESQVKDRVNEGVQGTILDEMIELAQKDGVINKEELTELIEKHQQESQELELKKQQQDQIAIKPRLDYLEKIKNFLDQTTIISKFSFIKEAGYENKDGFDKFTKYLLTLDENKQQRIIKVFKDNNDTENKIILDDYLDEDIGFGFPCNNKSYDVFIEKFEKLNKTVNEEQKVSNEEQKVSNEKQEKLNVEQEKSKKRTNLINEVSSKLKTKYTNLLPEMESKAIIELDNKGIKKEQIRKDIKEKNQTLDENKINELVETE